MKIKPSRSDFEKWINCIPQDNDLVFLSNDRVGLLKNLPFEVLSRDQVKALGLSMWTLNLRSWYGYLLNSADYCVSLPKGAIESFDEHLKSALLDEQSRLGVPTIQEGKWITSWVWSKFSKDEKISVLENWFVLNEIQTYDSIEIQFLPEDVQSEVARVGCEQLLNRFHDFSGPNCFATVAGIVENNKDIFTRWMHWPELEQSLGLNGFGPLLSDPQKGDILILSSTGENESPIHAAYYLGGGFYFEKPGQDFYEPYRIAKFENWSVDWPNSKLTIWRKQSTR